MIGKIKKLEVANVCYANVIGEFAFFCNPKNRGADFTWDWFIERCGNHADIWLMMNGTSSMGQQEIKELAKFYAIEIAQNCVNHYTDNFGEDRK